MIPDRDRRTLGIRSEIQTHDRLRQEGVKLDKAIDASKGDPAKVQAAKDAYDNAVKTADARLNELTRLASTARSADSPTSSTTAPGDASPGLASMRRPQNTAAARVTKGVAVWEVSQRTGVPVDRILEFNAQSGNPLVPKNLQIGQQVLVPMDPEDIKFRPLTAEQVDDLKVKAILEKRLESIAAPRIWSAEVPMPPPGGDPRRKCTSTRALTLCSGPPLGSDDGAARRAQLMEIEADDLATGSAPAELLLPGGPQVYGAIISALKKGGIRSYLESASYRIAKDGAFVHRAIDAPPHSFFFRNREDDNSDPCYAVQYRLVAQNRT